MNSDSSPAAPWAATGPREDGRAATVATGVGSMPGDDAAEAVRVVFGELPEFPHLPELPDRGVGADLTGRATALLVELHAEVWPSGWRLAAHPGRDARRAHALLRDDLDLLEEHAQGYRGPLKTQVAGPWTLAATLELPGGSRALADHGACRDIAESLAEGARAHVDELRRRLPDTDIVLQLDEPALPSVLAGAVPTASGYGRVRAVEQSVVETALGAVVTAAGVPVVVHCCAPHPPIGLLRAAGAAVLSIDAAGLDASDDDPLAEAIDEGTSLMLGVVPALETAGVPTPRQLAQRVLGLGRLGFPARRIADQVAVTPSCGLAGASPGWARAALKLARDTARILADTEV